MYRLLMLKGIKFSSAHLLSLPKCPSINQNCWTTRCMEFSPDFHWSQRMPHSTTVNLDALRLIRKKKKARKKKFTELLQVTESATKETKTSVKKLKSKKLSEFIGNPGLSTAASSSKLEFSKLNFTLENANKLQKEDIPMVFVSNKLGIKKINQLPPEVLSEILESYQCFREMAEVEEIVPPSNEVFLEEVEPLEEEIMEPIETLPVQTTSKSNKKKDKYKSRLHVSSEQQQLAKQKCLFTNISAYLELCASSGMLNRGLTTFLNYRSRWKRFNITRHFDIRLYNILLQGFAEKGNLAKIKEIIQILKADDVKMIPQSFAIIIECIGRQEPDLENTKLLQKFIKEANDQGISLNDVMDKSKFISDQREIVLDTIHRLEPNFTPTYTPPDLTYCNNLLNSLNGNVQEAGMKPKVPENAPEEKLDCIRRLMEEQLEVEMKGYLTVKSIEKFPEPTPLVQHYRSKLSELQTL